MNITSVPVATGPFFQTGHKVAAALVALPVLMIWWAVWRWSPRKHFSINNPYVQMRYVYAVVAGSMVGFLAGHALPNALLGDAREFKFAAFFAGIGLTVALMRFLRSCGHANFQIVLTTQREPYRLFDDETGDQRDVVSTRFGRTPAGTVISERPSSYYASDSSHEAEGVFNSISSSREGSPRRQVRMHQSMGDDMAEDLAESNDDHDVLWIRRWTATVLYWIYMVYGATDGVYMVYNHHQQPPEVLVACFWVSKMVAAITVSGFMVFAYMHLHPHRCRCCCRRWIYPTAGFMLAMNAITSCLPMYLDTTATQVAAWLVTNVFFGAFCAAVAGVMMTLAMLFIFFEVPETSARSEFAWWLIFVVAGAAALTTGFFL